MKLRVFVLISLLVGSFSSLWAANQHVHANAARDNTSVDQSFSGAKKLEWPGYCQIEIINHSYDDVRVFGVFDDGVSLEPFSIYSHESPHYISLFYYGYCHDGMDLYIDSFSGAHVYSGYVRRYSTIRVVPSYDARQLSAMVQSK